MTGKRTVFVLAVLALALLYPILSRGGGDCGWDKVDCGTKCCDPGTCDCCGCCDPCPCSEPCGGGGGPPPNYKLCCDFRKDLPMPASNWYSQDFPPLICGAETTDLNNVPPCEITNSTLCFYGEGNYSFKATLHQNGNPTSKTASALYLCSGTPPLPGNDTNITIPPLCAEPDDPACCGLCATNSTHDMMWDFSNPGCGGTVLGWESLPPQSEFCCGDDPGESYWYSDYHVSIESPPALSGACCDNASDCVDAAACTADGGIADIDANGDNDSCMAGTWYDCTGNDLCSGLCCFSNNCTYCSREDDVPAGCNDTIHNDGDLCLDGADSDCGGNETGFCFDAGDNDCDGLPDAADPDCGGTELNCTNSLDDDLNGYTDEDDVNCCAECEALLGAVFDANAPGTPGGCGAPILAWEAAPPQAPWCCGNDAGEHYIDWTGQGGDIACCDSAGDCVSASGDCQPNDIWSPGGCTDGADSDCDGLIDFVPDDAYADDPNCSATIDGALFGEDGALLVGVNVTVIAGATDPVTLVYVEFSTVTDTGAYSLDVIVNLTYNIVARLQTGGIAYEWDVPVDESNGRTATVNLTVRAAEGCEPDCTLMGEDTCRPECQGADGCAFFDVTSMRACDGSKAGWIVPYSDDFQVLCCEGTPSPKSQARILGVRGPRDVVRVTRIISYGGQLISLIVDVFQ